MLSWLAPLLVLGLVIFVHELGHFLAAKWAGVYAPRFSLGWGSPIWSFRRGETEYAISALPIGGYVRMASQEDEHASTLEGGPELRGDGAPVERSKHWDEHSMIPHGPKPIPPDRWFESKPLYKKLVILVAGVVMNVILAVVVSTGVFMYYGSGYLPAVVDSVVAERPAARAGMQRGDSIAAIDGVTIKRWDEVLTRVSAAPEQPLTFTVVRGGETLSLTITPEAQEIPSDSTGELRRVGRIGVGPRGTAQREPMAAGAAVVAGVNATVDMGASVLGVLGGLFKGNVSVSQLGGPVEIARASVTAAQSGLENMWALVAFLSINLAILNMLPIPLLDGGQIVLNLVEGAIRKPLPTVVKEWYARIGLAAILLLFVTVTFNDLKRLVTGWFGAGD
ncbi:RIP metalloprotease RseP [Pseudogemmatithrix spongiicola]|uniref:Zinc metalloprotease n=1 Tax=Pseudogemmatithrix spongiicola TaxID=3062599 RepID=A0AA49K123_9BACT|nr:RIP metalloprotease RseP [Gemmatimonadaceae bacterium 'strain 138']WKW15273.1 RIP metalloprotease RseP [Gemmatimonadaceae bacterium 'strain 318']